MIDNLIQSFAIDLYNGIPIRPYFDDPNDRELISFAQKLINVNQFNDVRDFISQYFNLRPFYQSLM